MATLYVNNVSGSDANNGLSEGAAKATITAALALATTAGDIVWVKNTGTAYAETANVTLANGTAAGTAAAPSKLCGYTSTPGDGGRPIITGGGSRANCITSDRGYWHFENLILTDATTRTFNLGLNNSFHHFYRVDFLRGSTTLSQGFYSQSGGTTGRASFWRCAFDGNTSNHLITNVSAKFVDCDFKNLNRSLTTAGGFDLQLLLCRFYNGTASFIVPGAVSRTLIVGCSFDANTMDAIDLSGATSEQHHVVNCAFANISGASKAAIRAPANAGHVAGWNAFFNCTANYAGGLAGIAGDVSLSALPWTGAGDFTPNEVSGGGAGLRGAGLRGHSIGSEPVTALTGGMFWRLP